VPPDSLAAAADPGIGAHLPLWSVLPFAGLLLSIALLPVFAPHFWHRHYARVTLFWAAAFAIPFLNAMRGEALHEILHIYLADYLPFLILLWGLFTVAGGIVLRGLLPSSPIANTAVLAAGTALASWLGTTGVSMLLIRPFLRANAWRRHRVHQVVFFIFLVSNIGGSLTPLGDPPLFLGFLHGVPFFWNFHLLPATLLCTVILLFFFFMIDDWHYQREVGRPVRAPKPNPADPDPAASRLRLDGAYNFLFFGGIVGAVLLSGVWRLGELTILGVRLSQENLVRDFLILVMGSLSLRFTTQDLRQANEFTWEPMREVAILFAGIFMTIIPALAILKAGAHGALGPALAGLTSPAHYFWASGGLSSFLDNAPTYLAFFNSLLGRFYPGVPEPEAVSRLIVEHVPFLVAVAAGSVFMGANTYIGNAPNFMVRSIAIESGVSMPSFLGYVLRWSLPLLIPIFVFATLVFIQ
jgi:Na+/H+ antiporter NhaD/arsenite permease-like protein